MWFIYHIDRHEKEHFWPLTIAFLIGTLIALPLVEAQRWFSEMGWMYPHTPGSTFLISFVLVALSEETLKFFSLRVFTWRATFFNEPLDGIVYSVMISMGFASLENILYALKFGISTTAVRAFTAVPAHAVFATMMGYYIGKARFFPERKQRFTLLAWLVPWSVHGIYDFFIIQEIYDALIVFAILTLGISIFFSFQLIAEEQDESPFK
ncbi:MAG: PrsW family intramembrane metalloprotease [Haliscomenobacter sp.]